MQILSKRDSTDGYKNGRFGNHLRQWNNPTRALAETSIAVGGKPCAFAVRYRGPGSSGPCVYNIPRHELSFVWSQHLGRLPEPWLYVSEMAPDHRLTFQGEICELPHLGGYALHWSAAKLPQRTALASQGNHKHGPGAKLYCKQFMDEDSYADLNALLDLYPLHTVEFSCFNARVGNLRRNTIFWEVRKF